jgi:hypothetical protein
MNKKETHHYRGGGYGELEAEIIERRGTQILSSRREEEADFDPRVVATIAEAETNQFDMQEGQYYTPQSNQK